ncbi:hypothetical protein KIH74_22605 [Kineosporia sp. J2-2]|uniref:Uncharacterized protein n=1 Tax=Kineosporia corallincola TaxID=2835133 RepID=A0ABS5TMY4_9ACTN|nr:hypothetical protein [Kineosporia corallincola]MBT0771749.1 hypothetical protein [Kineosporia corallincola]
MTDDLVARIADVLPPVRVSEVVAEWPADEAELCRSYDYDSIAERNEKLDQLRREKAARRVLEVLREAGRLRPVSCPTACDADCEGPCHEAHQPFWKREHEPSECSR